MKFGIFYELQLPRPWQAGDELKLYQDALTQLETADRLGYDHAWVVEHHFLEEYSHSPSPESFLAAASQRTRNIRLGHGIFQLTTNHPARVAERVAVLDLLSNGRCEFGMGESASITELTPFGRDMETKKEVFEEAVRAIFPMFQGRRQRASRQVFRHSLAQRGAQTGAEAASAAVDGVLAASDHRARRPARLWRARLPVRQRRCRACLGARLLQRDHQAAEEARRLRDQSEHGAGVVLHVREDRRGGARARRRRDLLPVRAALLRRLAEPPASRRPAPSTCGTNTTSGSAKIRKRRRRRCAAA